MNNFKKCSKTNQACFISGSLPEDMEKRSDGIEDKARKLCGELSKAFMNRNIKINTCFGMLIGNYISFPIVTKCMRDGESMDEYLNIYPLDNRESSEVKNEIRTKIINGGSFFVVMGGGASRESGVYQEYLIAKTLGKYIIPIPYLGGCGKLIYEEIKSEDYLSKYIEQLGSEDIQCIVNAVTQIIDNAICD